MLFLGVNQGKARKHHNPDVSVFWHETPGELEADAVECFSDVRAQSSIVSAVDICARDEMSSATEIRWSWVSIGVYSLGVPFFLDNVVIEGREVVLFLGTAFVTA